MSASPVTVKTYWTREGTSESDVRRFSLAEPVFESLMSLAAAAHRVGAEGLVFEWTGKWSFIVDVNSCQCACRFCLVPVVGDG